MTDTSRLPAREWTVKPAVLLAGVCLAVGIAGGWGIRAWRSSAAAAPAKDAGIAAAAGSQASPAAQTPSPARLKEMADAQAAPLLEKLKADPNNADLLTSAGNLYYDAQQYSSAVDYYGRALKARPSEAAVRTDMATAYWYMGNADRALSEFDKALAYAPNNPNTLYNRGLVRWKGKADGAGALADWQKLLAAYPNYTEKNKIEEMMAEVKQHGAATPGTKTN